MRAKHDFRRNVEVRNIVGFGDEWCGTRAARIGLDDVHLIVFDGKLDVDQTFDIQGSGDFFAVLGHLLYHDRAEGVRRQYRAAVAGVNTRWFNVFHHTHDVEVVTVENGVNFSLFRPFEELVDEYFVVGHVFENGEHLTLQLCVVDDDFHALSTQHVRWAYEQRIRQSFGDFKRGIYVVRDTKFRVRNIQLMQQF